MKKYIITRILNFNIIEEIEEQELISLETSESKEYINWIISDTLEEVCEKYDFIMDEQNCWLLVLNEFYYTFRIVEYIDGPEELYLEKDEVIVGSYSHRMDALRKMQEFKKLICKYVICGNKNTGELREFRYTGGPMIDYLYLDEVIIRISTNPEIDMYKKCSGWTERWRRVYQKTIK